MTRGRRVQTSTLVRRELDGQPVYVGNLITQVPDLATQQLVKRGFKAIFWTNRRYWNRIELFAEHPE